MRRVLSLAAAGALVAGLFAATTAHADPAPSSSTATTQVVVRPVDATGHAVPGWTVTREHDGVVQCWGPAPSSVDPGIVGCSPSAAYLPACWKSAHHSVLCLRDARVQQLVRVRYTGSLHRGAAPDRPQPLDLRLSPRQHCAIRVGGAWGQLPSHPNWVGYYSCAKGSVYGPPDGDGINRSHRVWTVHLWKSGTRDDVVVRAVRKAWLVGTAS